MLQPSVRVVWSVSELENRSLTQAICLPVSVVTDRNLDQYFTHVYMDKILEHAIALTNFGTNLKCQRGNLRNYVAPRPEFRSVNFILHCSYRSSCSLVHVLANRTHSFKNRNIFTAMRYPDSDKGACTCLLYTSPSPRDS